MLKRKGSTLIETILAFSIFIGVIVMFVSLFGTIYKSNNNLNNRYENLNCESFERCEDFTDTIEMALHL